MQSNSFRMLIPRLLPVPLVLLACAAPAAAQTTTFDPLFGVLYGYTDNVGFGGTQNASDNMTRFDFTLP